MRIDDPGAVLSMLAARHRMPGAQLAVADADGLRTVEHGRGVTRDSAFPIGSLTKPFTAALAMTLVDDGDLGLDAAEVPGATYTLRQLLSHTAGLPSGVTGTAGSTRRRWVAGHARDADLVHRPGEVFSYSNAGYLVAGHLIEEATGLPWSDAMADILLGPLGIKAGFVTGPRAGDRAVRAGHDRRGAPVAEQDVPEIEEPAGALALSAADLARFGLTFCIRPDDPMVTDQLAAARIGPYGLADGWALGWARYRRGLLGHDGTGDGTSCHLRFDPATRELVALTTDSAGGHDLWLDLLDRLGLGDAAPEVAHGSPPDGCAGRYVNGDAEFEVVVRDQVAQLIVDGHPYASLACRSDLTFTLGDAVGGAVPYPGRFLRDPGTGHITFVQISGRVARRTERTTGRC